MSGEGRGGKEGKKRGEGRGGHSWQGRKDYARKGGKRGEIEDRQGEGRGKKEREGERRSGGEGENPESSITFRRNTYIKYWDLVT